MGRNKGIYLKALFVLLILFIPWISYSSERVISLSPQITESIYLLGAEDSLIANTIFCKRPRGAEKKAKIGTPLRPDIEKIVSLMPDMVFGSQEGNPLWLMERLKRLGINVQCFKRPKDFNELSQNFLILAQILHREDRARAIINRAQSILEKRHNQPPFRVLWQVGSDPFIAATKKSFANDIIRLSGGINIIETELPYSRVNIEEVIRKDPHVIVLMDMGYSIDAEIRRWRGLLKDPKFLIIDPYVAAGPTPLTFVEAVEKLRQKGASVAIKR